jgi:hypothetical protein
MKQVIYLKTNKNYYVIKKECADLWNIVLIKIADGTLADNSAKIGSIADDILRHVHNFTRVPGHHYVGSTTGASKTCGGTAYEGWVIFGKSKNTIDYLKRYFKITYF